MKRSAKDKIVQALICLMKKKDINKITIKELVDSAGVNRSTYYYYFYRIQDVIEYMMELFLEKVAYVVTHDEDFILGGENDEYITSKTEYIYRFILQNKDVFSAIVKSGYKNQFYEKIVEVMEQQYKKYAHYYTLSRSASSEGACIAVCPDEYEKEESIIRMTDKEKQYWDLTSSYAFIGALECWVRREFQEEPEELIYLTYGLSEPARRIQIRVD